MTPEPKLTAGSDENGGPQFASVVTSKVDRPCTMYGKDVVENWRATVEQDEGGTDVSFSVNVKPGPGGGSKTLHKEKDVPREHVPDNVAMALLEALQLADEAIDSAGGRDAE